MLQIAYYRYGYHQGESDKTTAHSLGFVPVELSIFTPDLSGISALADVTQC